MYKCRDCGQTYQEYVEYCDCGNNTFDVLEQVVNNEKSKSFRNVTLESLISWSIFIFCVMLSLVIVFCVGNSKNTEKKSKPAVVLVKNSNIPALNSFWDDTPIKVETPKVVEKPLADVKTSSRKVEDPPYVKLFKQEPKKQQKPVQKPKENKVKDVSVSLPISTKDSQLSKVKQEQDRSGLIKKEEVQPSPKPQPKPQVTDYNNPEFILYKNALLQKLFSRFVVSGVSGSGTCVVSFSVSDNGKLLNRKFEQQSDNKSLNDAVYYMMMSVPSFNPPPQAYKGDTLRLKFLFNNGIYEFSYL